MERRTLGRTGLSVSALGFGCAVIAYQRKSCGYVDRLLNTVVDLGVNVIDTAECYPGSEEAVGRYLSHRRADVVLLTKCGHSEWGQSAPDWDARILRAGLDRSLRRLRTDCVDVLHLHSCPLEVVLRAEVIDFLIKARQVGKTRFIGYSGDGDAAAESIRCGIFDVLQTSVNVADQYGLTNISAAHQCHIGVIAKRPLANVAWQRLSKPSNMYNDIYRTRLRKLAYPFLALELPDAVATALRFTLGLPGIATAVVGTTSLAHLRRNVAIASNPVETQGLLQDVQQRWASVADKNWTGRT